MYRALAVAVLATALVSAVPASAATPAPRIYVGALPGGGKIKFRTWPGRVRAKFRVLTSCNNGGDDDFVEEQGLRQDLKRRRFRISNVISGDSGDGAGFTKGVVVRGRARRDRVVGWLEWDFHGYSVRSGDDLHCRSGRIHFTAWRRR
jgi:hypothetical protein